ncbi:type III-B CRISPR-associated protein Cas10/Cmr2 [Gloeothece verrucosa]|uniref:CRISPR-associated protein, Crm2 family n=1 Tax=Gloeothece verrucosa (strain PCC 7822) TaxID=497965 RepID=E0UMM2_GLOV7|nr:type III-B CRISPR-associated protein Cas10/Cmr2 [Gloeothece verrucosa]ADN18202.1 CRISPR-associated protein, Crm2 family [Gloeothece verrucosa PCC 7822]
MCQSYWEAKIRGIIHPFNLTKIENLIGQNNENKGYWETLKVLLAQSTLDLNIITLAAEIANASDRTVLNSLSISLENNNDFKVSHLLSGDSLNLSLSYSNYQKLLTSAASQQPLSHSSSENTNTIELEEIKELYWWLWRCLPEIICQKLSNQDNFLLPASLILPDASIWSYASITSAIAGALVGYSPSQQQEKTSNQPQTPYLATFSFTPIQEIIKASRKMRDFWAGSWVLHYLSAKVCWKLAQIYGADCLIYPSLFQQPLIDHWLRNKWPNFSHWIDKPTEKAILTAGFPNVIVILLPSDKVPSAMQTARETVIQEWLVLGKKVFKELENRRWTRELSENSPTWQEWLRYQWQTYWTALPINNKVDPLTWQIKENSEAFQQWQDELNRICQLNEENKLFNLKEHQFIQAVAQEKPDLRVNIGSWWCYLFDQLRLTAGSVKNSRNWCIPSSFYPRSTISGLGSVVYPQPQDYRQRVTEGDTRQYWQEQGGLFDGNEQLNATEVLKRGLHRILPELLFNDPNKKIPYYYPDLSSGVAGWLKFYPDRESNFIKACEAVKAKFDWTYRKRHSNDKRKPLEFPAILPWGIPWIDEDSRRKDWPNPRLLNAGWLIDDFPLDTDESLQIQKDEAAKLRNCISKYFNQGNNPTDWYVIATGDGDGMSKWLKGDKLNNYADYMLLNQPISNNESINRAIQGISGIKKRMGPSTHNALSRALLDFSNRLVPYLTEERYAGRLIYSGGDDVLAYTNLWEWDNWLWDIRECFRGKEDPRGEFNHEGNYWKRKSDNSRPLFTMGKNATVSFGVVIAHHSVPLAIALENLWDAEKKAKNYQHQDKKKDAVQVRVLFGNGNKLQALAQFDLFYHWKQLIELKLTKSIEPSLFEIAAQLWEQHPAPCINAIKPWTIAFCERREGLQGEDKERFQNQLEDTLTAIYNNTPEPPDSEIKNWLKLAAFVLRNRNIKPIQGENNE